MRILRRHDGLLVERLTLRARTCEFEPQLGQLVVAVFPKIVIIVSVDGFLSENSNQRSSIHEDTINDYTWVVPRKGKTNRRVFSPGDWENNTKSKARSTAIILH